MRKLNHAHNPCNETGIPGNSTGLSPEILEAESIFSAGGSPDAFAGALRGVLLERPDLRPVVTQLYGWALRDDNLRSEK